MEEGLTQLAPGSKESTLMRFFDLKPGPQPGTPGDYPLPKRAASPSKLKLECEAIPERNRPSKRKRTGSPLSL